jgi:hypothetical protein
MDVDVAEIPGTAQWIVRRVLEADAAVAWAELREWQPAQVTIYVGEAPDEAVLATVRAKVLPRCPIFLEVRIAAGRCVPLADAPDVPSRLPLEAAIVLQRAQDEGAACSALLGADARPLALEVRDAGEALALRLAANGWRWSEQRAAFRWVFHHHRR